MVDFTFLSDIAIRCRNLTILSDITITCRITGTKVQLLFPYHIWSLSLIKDCVFWFINDSWSIILLYHGEETTKLWYLFQNLVWCCIVVVSINVVSINKVSTSSVLAKLQCLFQNLVWCCIVVVSITVVSINVIISINYYIFLVLYYWCQYHGRHQYQGHYRYWLSVQTMTES